MRKRDGQWYARGGGIARMGPFSSYEEASQALIRSPAVHPRYDNADGTPVDGAFVWWEPKKELKR
jgi:hypothetical protein